jgi:hypothetical protein
VVGPSPPCPEESPTAVSDAGCVLVLAAVNDGGGVLARVLDLILLPDAVADFGTVGLANGVRDPHSGITAKSARTEHCVVFQIRSGGGNLSKTHPSNVTLHVSPRGLPAK